VLAYVQTLKSDRGARRAEIIRLEILASLRLCTCTRTATSNDSCKNVIHSTVSQLIFKPPLVGISGIETQARHLAGTTRICHTAAPGIGGNFYRWQCTENTYIGVFYSTSTLRVCLRVHCNTWVGFTSRNVSEPCVQLNTPSQVSCICITGWHRATVMSTWQVKFITE